jgi:hypothetical protein
MSSIIVDLVQALFRSATLRSSLVLFSVVILSRQRIVNKYTPDLFARRPTGRQA